MGLRDSEGGRKLVFLGQPSFLHCSELNELSRRSGPQASSALSAKNRAMTTC